MQIQILVTRNVCVEIIANLHHFSGTQVHSRRCASDLPFLSCRRTSLPSTSPSPRDAFDSIRLDTNRTEPLNPLRYRYFLYLEIRREKKEERRREPRTFRSRQRRHLTSSRFAKLRVSFRKRSDSCRSGSVGFEPWVRRRIKNRLNHVQTLRGSFSAVSTPSSARKYSFESSWRDLRDLHACAPLNIQNFSKSSSNVFACS